MSEGRKVGVVKQDVKDAVDFEKRMRQLAAGAGSGAFTKTSIAPLERVKILLQIQGMHSKLAPKYNGIVSTLTTVVREEGVLALYKGNGANVLRIIPTYALKFSFNDTFKDLVKKETTRKKLTFQELIFSGSLAGLFQITMTYPLELIRTRLTLSEGMKQGARFEGIFDCAKKTVQVEGWGALYKGITPTWLSGAPYVGLQMTFFEIFKRNVQGFAASRLGEKEGEGGMSSQALNTVTTLVSGAGAGIVAQTITYPGDTIRRRMQADGIGGSKRIYSGFIDCITGSVRSEGVLCLYKGLSANTVRCIPGAAIQFWAYDTLKYVLKCT